MELIINHHTKQFDLPELTIQQLVAIEHGAKLQGLAVAVNDIVIPQSQWATTYCHQRDNVLIITATQGG